MLARPCLAIGVCKLSEDVVLQSVTARQVPGDPDDDDVQSAAGRHRRFRVHDSGRLSGAKNTRATQQGNKQDRCYRAE